MNTELKIEGLNPPAPETDTLVFTPEQIKEITPIPSLKLVGEFDPILKETMPEYDFESQTYEQRKVFADSMIATMRGVGSIGLSACQVGFRIRMFVMDTIVIDPKTNNMKRGEPMVCYNPKIIESSDKKSAVREACLTFPGMTLQVKRSDLIKVHFFDHEENELELDLEGLLARIYQHELDHMNGILFTSKVAQGVLSWEREKQRKLVRKYRKQFNQFKNLSND